MRQFKKTPNDLTLVQICTYFATDEKARTHLESIRWPDGPICPTCGIQNPMRISKVRENEESKIRGGLYCCKDCRRQFTVTTKSIFESTHIPLRKWLIAWYLICTSKKGVSSLQLQRMLELGSYRTALFMAHRIRHALKDPSFSAPLSGVVEMDETYVGGKPRGTGKPGRPAVGGNKTPVVSLVERDGSKRSMVMERITGQNLANAVTEHVRAGAAVMTDSYPSYKALPKTHAHHSVNHKAGEYARQEGTLLVHTNTVESSFSLLKRGVYGTFHHVSKKHLPLYLAEFDHRWNTRGDSDGERTVAGIKKAAGKRLMYRQPKAGSK